MQIDLKLKLDTRPDLQKYLFRRGFLISRQKIEELNSFPFYGNWKVANIGGWHFMTHKEYKFHYHNAGDVTFFLMGHSYNPFTMEHEEVKQLAHIAAAYGNEIEFQNRIDELTGIFILGWFDKYRINYLTDPSGMQSSYYGVVNGNMVITSHTQLIADIYDLPMSDLVKELLGYKWYYRVLGPYLPGDLSPNEEVKRVVPNILYKYIPSTNQIHTKRFYPLRDIKECKTIEQYQKTIEEAADILKNGAKLVLKKWKKPAISLTGGIDSNTTYAAVNGLYDKFASFSYLSTHKETIDVDAAKKIANAFGTEHRVYTIPENNSDLSDYEIKSAILQHNNGYIAPPKDNESRKRIYLEEHCSYDVEVKSWVSETIRAYWYKYYRRTKMPELSPRLFRNLYKIFITNRGLAHRIDKVFADYIDKYEYAKIPKQYCIADMHYHEVSWGSWGGINISEMKYCFDITILYNNRCFLDLLFKVPLEKRICDQHHLDMKKYLNKELYDMHIRVVNMKETKMRAFLLNVIFSINNQLPF